MPVVPDQARTFKVGLDHSENLTEVFGGAIYISFRFLLKEVVFMVREVMRGYRDVPTLARRAPEG